MIGCELQPGVEDEFERAFGKVAKALEDFGFSVDIRGTYLVADLYYLDFDEKTIGEFSTAFGDGEIGRFLTERVEGVLRDALSDIAGENGETVARHLGGKNPEDLSIDGMRAALKAMSGELEYDLNEYAGYHFLVVDCGYGVQRETESSPPQGVAIRIDMADDEASTQPHIFIKNGEIEVPPFDLGECVFMLSSRTEAVHPEDVTIDDAKAACGRFLERLRLPGADAEREGMAP